jgi:hypothetical protein
VFPTAKRSIVWSARSKAWTYIPVAVTLAWVTYFLGPSPERLSAHDELTVPVFLGDSVCCEQDHTLLSKDGTRPRVERRILAEPHGSFFAGSAD